MKRIAALIFAVISMILYVSCDSTDSHEVARIVIYTEPVTIAETVGIDYTEEKLYVQLYHLFTKGVLLRKIENKLEIYPIA